MVAVPVEQQEGPARFFPQHGNGGPRQMEMTFNGIVWLCPKELQIAGGISAAKKYPIVSI
jgi:hypothetical protein